MMDKLDDRQQKFLALGILLGLVLAVFAAIAVPWWSALATYRIEIEQLETRLARLRQVVASDAELRPQYEQIRRRQRSAGHILKGSTDAVAAAELQGLLKNLAGTHRAQVLSTQILPASAEDQFVRVEVRARLRGELPALVDTLYSIETYRVFLFLDNVAIRAATDRRNALPGAVAQFEADIDVVTYLPGDS